VRWTYSWYASPSGLGEPPDRYGMGVRALSGRTERSDPRPHIYSPRSVGSKSCAQWFRVSQMILREQISMGLSARWAISHTKWAVLLDKKAGRNGLSKIFDVKLKGTCHASPKALCGLYAAAGAMTVPARPVRARGGWGLAAWLSRWAITRQLAKTSAPTGHHLPTGQNRQLAKPLCQLAITSTPQEQW
jgi:hypothetical protein